MSHAAVVPWMFLHTLILLHLHLHPQPHHSARCLARLVEDRLDGGHPAAGTPCASAMNRIAGGGKLARSGQGAPTQHIPGSPRGTWSSRPSHRYSRGQESSLKARRTQQRSSRRWLAAAPYSGTRAWHLTPPSTLHHDHPSHHRVLDAHPVDTARPPRPRHCGHRDLVPPK